MKKIENKTNKENNLIEDDGFNPELETVDYDLILNEKEMEEKWLECLEKDFKQKIEKFKPLATINNWIIPDLNIFPDYLSDLEKKLQDKYKDNPEILIQKYDDRKERYQTHSTSRVTKELYPIVFETYDRTTIHFPKPEIPESYILDWMAWMKRKLSKNGLIQNNTISTKIAPPKKVQLPPILTKPIRHDLKELFKAKYDDENKWNEIVNTLKRKEKLDPETGFWQKSKSELAGTIRIIESRCLTLSKNLSIKEIIAISKTNFNRVLNNENCRGETVEKWNHLEIGK